MQQIQLVPAFLLITLAQGRLLKFPPSSMFISVVFLWKTSLYLIGQGSHPFLLLLHVMLEHISLLANDTAAFMCIGVG